jgi:hypothetical protein
LSGGLLSGELLSGGTFVQVGFVLNTFFKKAVKKMEMLVSYPFAIYIILIIK